MSDEPRPEFPVVRRGYDREWVDAYLDRVNDELTRLAAENRKLHREDARDERDALEQLLAAAKASVPSASEPPLPLPPPSLGPA